MVARQIISALFLAACISGFTVQAGYLLRQYLRYATVTKLSIKSECVVQPAAFSFRARLSKIVALQKTAELLTRAVRYSI